MKILILANSDVGLFRFRKELINCLIASRYQIFISTPFGNYIDYFIKLGCCCINTPIKRHGKNPLSDLKLLITYKKIIKTIKPDVVLTYTIKPNIYGGIVCRSKGINYLPNITGLGKAVENSNPLLQSLIITMYRFALKKAKTVFFQNQENKQFMISKRIVKNNYDVLPGSGVNVDEFYFCEYPTSDVINFVFISRIFKEKGIDQYLEAAKSVKQRHNNVVFHIFGALEEDYEETIQKYQNDGYVFYHGAVEDVAKVYRMASCVVHPTYYPEGMSNVLLESCSTGRPIITTNRSGCREIVEDGINGFIVNECDTNDLILKLEKFIGLTVEQKKTMGIMGRKKIESCFDRKIVISRYIKAIEGCIQSEKNVL